jgi:rhodanese-related sulfurtransferase
MKKILFLMILSLITAYTLSWAQSDTLPNNLVEKVNTPEGLKKVIDSVRDESAYKRGHIPTAINIPFGHISDTKNPPPKDKYLILYCYGGRSSRAAGKRLKANGYKYIFVWGGIKNWPYELETSK